ncbi:hypothetical protein DCS_03351 [Drechmeria coniospora]|uniref:Uncharacterized protein n=1 Tax=Drechmeria coniospora TaxID=98403 RepID=A0A151GH46_DRECN|nr:hypothetical protein DCS_03351 [Drechmeria coniospora]KYK56351.1 hypothetical protein DCS_03351 [Drechmeria coniospora]
MSTAVGNLFPAISTVVGNIDRDRNPRRPSPRTSSWHMPRGGHATRPWADTSGEAMCPGQNRAKPASRVREAPIPSSSVTAKENAAFSARMAGDGLVAPCPPPAPSSSAGAPSYRRCAVVLASDKVGVAMIRQDAKLPAPTGSTLISHPRHHLGCCTAGTQVPAGRTRTCYGRSAWQ